MLTNPLSMFEEEKCLYYNSGVTDAFSRMYIDSQSVVTTPYHRADNRLRELARGSKMHGSCGMGISATAEDILARPNEVLRMGNFLDKNILLNKLKATRLVMLDGCKKIDFPKNNPLVEQEFTTFDETLVSDIMEMYLDFSKKVHIINQEEVKKLFDESETVIFEPAQGVLLDENYGFHPYTTWTTTTLKNAYTILNDLSFKGNIQSYGILRTFDTRHGPGPFVTEDKHLTDILADPHNTLNLWQKGFRCGWLDLVMLKYALKANGNVDNLSVTHIDFLDKLDKWKVCKKYTLDGLEWTPEIPKSIEEQIELTKCLEKVVPVYEEYSSNQILYLISEELETNIKIYSYGPTAEDKLMI